MPSAKQLHAKLCFATCMRLCLSCNKTALYVQSVALQNQRLCKHFASARCKTMFCNKLCKAFKTSAYARKKRKQGITRSYYSLYLHNRRLCKYKLYYKACLSFLPSSICIQKGRAIPHRPYASTKLHLQNQSGVLW